MKQQLQKISLEKDSLERGLDELEQQINAENSVAKSFSGAEELLRELREK